VKAIRAVRISRAAATSAEEARRIAERWGVRGLHGGRLEPVEIVAGSRAWRIVVRDAGRFVRGTRSLERRGAGVVVEWGELRPT
jgi:hypothetical protein